MVALLIFFVVLVLVSPAYILYKRHQRVKEEWREAFERAMRETDNEAPIDWSAYYNMRNK